jgi:hypothetical protein
MARKVQRPSQGTVRKESFHRTLRGFEDHLRVYVDQEQDELRAEMAAKLTVALTGFYRLHVWSLHNKIRWLQTPWYVRTWRRSRSFVKRIPYLLEPVVDIAELAPGPPSPQAP